MIRKRRLYFAAFSLALALTVSLAGWVWWGAWPGPQPEPVVADADAIVILGGGDDARWQKGLEVASDYPKLPVVVTGDDNFIVDELTSHGMSANRIVHEQSATSTGENAKFTGPLLDRLGARRVILVTNWFHAPRSLATFRKYQPGREFVVASSPRPEPLRKWDELAARRERLAVIYYWIVHGVRE